MPLRNNDDEPPPMPPLEDERKKELEDVYLMWPKINGLANDMLIQTEGGKVLYHVHSKLFAPLGRQYTILDSSMQVVASTKQDHTAIFPRHSIFMGNKPVGKLGQEGVIPQNYFIEINRWPRLMMRISVFESIYQVRSEKEVVAEVAQHRTQWIVAVLSNVDRLLLLASLAIIYRENTIGG